MDATFIPLALRGCLETVSCHWRSWLPHLLAQEEVRVGGRRFRIIRRIAAGGFSDVFLVQPICNGTSGRLQTESSEEYALKRIYGASPEILRAALFEVKIMSKLAHANLLPLLSSAVVPTPVENGVVQTCYMLLPLFPGSLVDLIEDVDMRRTALPTEDIIAIFLQVAEALQAMHRMQYGPIIHRDVKPHNVLLRHPIHQAAPSKHSKYQAVLMDFGSCQIGPVNVGSRLQAMEVQEEAERLCTAAYRAPELFDVRSDCTIGEAVDVWSLGCLLYYMMMHMSPFEHVLASTGGSLSLAVQAGADSLRWTQEACHQDLQDLVRFCLVVDPLQRPTIEDVLQRAVKAHSSIVGAHATQRYR